MNKFINVLSISSAAFILFFSLAAAYAETELYETGPGEESSYIRFVNGTERDISIISSNGSSKIELSAKAEGRVSRFFAAKAGSKVSATVQAGAHKVPVDVVGKPWEYITIAVLPNGAAQVTASQVKETPGDFNAMRASLALFNLDAKCTGAAMKGGAQSATILSDVKPSTVQRRLVNPVKLKVLLACAGQSAETTVDMEQLQAGERYSIFLLSLKNARLAFFARDAN